MVEEKEIKVERDSNLVDLLPSTYTPILNRDVYKGFPSIDGCRYPLIRNNVWLRWRNGEHELKIVERTNRQGGLRVSREVKGERGVETYLDETVLSRVGHDGLDDPRLSSLVHVETRRDRYQRDGYVDSVDELTIDVDTVRFWDELVGKPDYTWEIAELEVLAASVAQAKKEINKVIDMYDLRVHRQRKIVTYLERTDSHLYDFIPSEDKQTGSPL